MSYLDKNKGEFMHLRHNFKTSEDVLKWAVGRDVWLYAWNDFEGTYVYLTVLRYRNGRYECEYVLAPESGLNDKEDLGILYEGDYTPEDINFDLPLDEIYNKSEMKEYMNALIDEYWSEGGLWNRDD